MATKHIRAHPHLPFSSRTLFLILITSRCVSLPSLPSHSAPSPSSTRPTLTLRSWLPAVARPRAPSTALTAAPISTAPISAVKSYWCGMRRRSGMWGKGDERGVHTGSPLIQSILPHARTGYFDAVVHPFSFTKLAGHFVSFRLRAAPPRPLRFFGPTSLCVRDETTAWGAEASINRVTAGSMSR
ncbi:hypothetical protein C8J57DRAFT_1713817, partial [Mycena rebaudengoi]